jgi:predicted DNA-binding transcriptional regulator AlpA
MADPLLSKRDVAKRLGVSERTLERSLETGDGPPHIRISGAGKRGRVMFRPAALDEWLRSREVGGHQHRMAKRSKASRSVRGNADLVIVEDRGACGASIVERLRAAIA